MSDQNLLKLCESSQFFPAEEQSPLLGLFLSATAVIFRAGQSHLLWRWPGKIIPETDWCSHQDGNGTAPFSSVCTSIGFQIILLLRFSVTFSNRIHGSDHGISYWIHTYPSILPYTNTLSQLWGWVRAPSPLPGSPSH